MAHARYYWVILADHVEGGQRVGCGGPRSADPARVKRGTSFPEEGERFRLYDDDGRLCYEGWITGDYTGFEPLDDFGMPNAGCTEVRYMSPETGRWERL